MPVLEASELSVRFGGHQAVRDVDLRVEGGTIVGLIGPNGAGKTTTFNALSGVQPCGGTVHLDGVDVTSLGPHRRARLGLSRTFQRLEVFGSMTARENVRVAVEAQARWGGGRLRGSEARAAAILERVGLATESAERVDAMPIGQARLVELARAIAIDPKALLLDEPASGQDETETARLSSVLASLAADGLAILIVEHDVELVMALCADIYVMDLGGVIAHGPPDQVRNDALVRRAYLG